MAAATLAGAALLTGAMLSAGVPRRVTAQAAASPRTTAAAPSSPAAVRRVAGHVVRPGTRGMLPASDTWVTLHRVGSDTAGPLDSLRTRADGAYAFAYRPFGSDEAVYFVSASYGGIAYFSEPLRGDAVTGEAAEITVFDTTSAPVPLTVRGRHLIVTAAAASGARTVTEVYELSNDTTLTAVAPPSGATFAAIVPTAATELRVGGGDIAQEAVSFVPGRAAVSAPFAPGLKQFSFTYTLRAEAFPLTVPVERGAQVLEVLVEDPTASVSGGNLAPVNPASVSGRTFKRFLAQDVAANAVVKVDVPARAAFGRTAYLAVVAAVTGAAMLAALVSSLTRRRAVPAATSNAPGAEDLAREIADLDLRFERQAAPGDAERAGYEARRAELKARLSAALAPRHGA